MPNYTHLSNSPSSSLLHGASFFPHFPPLPSPPMSTSVPLPFLLPLPLPKPTHRFLRSHFRPAAIAGISASGGITRDAREDFGGLEALYDDGFGSKSVKDYFAAVKEISNGDGDDGPPRWFCPAECGQPIEGSPVLFFLPGADGTGMGLILHQQSLGKVFEVRCLHIPVNDRTPFEGLVKFVETSVQYEHVLAPKKPIYLVGDSFGGCLALAIAARNPSIDLVLVLVNPATSFDKSQLQPFIPALEALPRDLHSGVPYVLSMIMGDPVKMAMTNITEDLPPGQTLSELSNNLASFLPLLSDLADILPKDTLLWKLKLLKAGTAYTNSRLHAVEAEVLLLVSGKDNLLPSGSEADRLRKSLKNCNVRYFKENGHTLLLEDGMNLLSVIKGTVTYRRSKRHDFITDYLPPTKSEFIQEFDRDSRLFSLATSPVVFSTLQNGKIVRGLAGVPNEGPVLLVGYHMLFGLELGPLYEAFLREKGIIIRGMAHPILFSQPENSRTEMSRNDTLRIFGALPVSPTNMYKLLSRKSFVLLYPGGAREALHRKGEEYKLFWPDQPEFVRMAAKFNATILPFGTVGEDDIAELVLDYDDQMNIPFVQNMIESFNQNTINLRTDMDGEISNQNFHFPGIVPKVPGRFYFLFGKPFETRGLNILEDRKTANEVYANIKSETESLMSYLKEKREEDPYRSFLPRTVYRTSWGWGSHVQIPSFEP